MLSALFTCTSVRTSYSTNYTPPYYEPFSALYYGNDPSYVLLEVYL